MDASKLAMSKQCIHSLLADIILCKSLPAEAIEALTKAVAENAALKAQARKDIEFAKWAYETDFQNVLR